MRKTEDSSIIGEDGRLLYCSTERFLRDICEGDHCFICGRSEREVRFNREHVLPNWMLHRYDLHRKTLTLPNGEEHRYGTYTLPCCHECNTELSRDFENPVSAAFATGFHGIMAMIREEGTDRLFQWLALIFLKLHLKDRRLRRYLNSQLGDEMISADYVWEAFHHLHCLARAQYTGAVLGDGVAGSMAVMELVPQDDDEPFDMASRTDAATIFLRAGDVALYAVFTDSCSCVQALAPLINRIEGPLNPVQARELAAEFAAASLHLENPPSFHTSIRLGGRPVIGADLEPGGPRFAERDKQIVGAMKVSLLEPFFDNCTGRKADEVAELAASDRLSFLFDDDGRFIRDGRCPREAAP